LRGRVGRGTAKSTCLLLYQEPLGPTAKARLTIMRETEDGFRIADLAAHGDLLAAARDDAALVLARDAELNSARGAALRTLLYLFERDEAVKLLSAG